MIEIREEMCREMSEQKRVDVVILTHQPDERFREELRRLKQQRYPVGQIYVINTRSKSFPKEVARMEGVSVTHIEPEEFDHGGTRDLGFRLSDAELLVFMTQDALPADKDMIGELVKPLLASKGVGVSYARQLPAKGCDEIERYTRIFNYPPKARVKGKEDLPVMGIKTFFCSDVCAAYQRTIYREMGGFTRRTIFNEDMVIAAKMVKAGYQVAYAANARVIHSHNYSGRQQFQRNFDLAVSQADHPEVFKGIRSEAEGIRMVRDTALYLLKKGKWYLLPVLLYKSGCKYLGYKAGQNYRKMPLWMVKRCSASKAYWEKYAENNICN
jgi:Glycosyltransferases, probably involved in cell wall biogenesis